MKKDEISLVQKVALEEYSADGGIKKYPSLELVRIEKKFFNIHNNTPRLLEYGFGSGCNTECLLEEGYEIYGIDVSKTALANTKKRLTIRSQLEAGLKTAWILLDGIQVNPQKY